MSVYGARLQKASTIVLLASLAVFGLAMLWVLLFGTRTGPVNDAVGLISVGSAVLTIFAAASIFAAVVVRRGEMPVLMTASMLAGVGATVMWIVFAEEAQVQETTISYSALKVAMTLSILGLGLPGAGLLMTSPHEQRLLVVCRTIVLVAGTVAGAAALLLMWSRWWQSRTFVLVVAMGIGIVVTALGVFALLVAGWHVRRTARVALGSLPGRPRLELRCPRCQHQQEMSSGIDRCTQCGLTLMIDVEEPRCMCGYLLFRLQGDECPECGRKVDTGPDVATQS